MLVHVHDHTHDRRAANRKARHISKLLAKAVALGLAPSTQVRVRRLKNAAPTRTSTVARLIHPRRAFRGHPWFSISWDILDRSRKPILTPELCAQFGIAYNPDAPSDKILPMKPRPQTKRQRRAARLARYLAQHTEIARAQ